MNGFFDHLLIWLGKFHPPMVNFPIGLLIAAAVAEFLLIVTKRPFFQSCTRYCIWFGTLSAVVTAVLGWFFSAAHPASWILTTHRWLGTSTAAWSLLLLAIAEVHYRRGGRAARYGFRFALVVAACLVGVTGFFGGAMVYGIDHYAWPAGRGHEKEEQQEHHHHGEEPHAAAGAGQEARTVTVTMTGNLRFEPGTATVRQGQTVLWKNTTDLPHTVTGDPALAERSESVRLPPGAAPFNSGVIAPGQTYSHTFTVAGHYRYFCIPHERMGMIGEVEVKPPEGPEARK